MINVLKNLFNIVFLFPSAQGPLCSYCPLVLGTSFILSVPVYILSILQAPFTLISIDFSISLPISPSLSLCLVWIDFPMLELVIVHSVHVCVSPLPLCSSILDVVGLRLHEKWILMGGLKWWNYECRGNTFLTCNTQIYEGSTWRVSPATYLIHLNIWVLIFENPKYTVYDIFSLFYKNLLVNQWLM